MNKSFLYKITPFKVSLYGILFWLLLYFFASVNIKKPVGFYPFIYIISSYLFFMLGALCIKTPKKVTLTLLEDDKKKLLKFLYIIIIIAFLGFIFRFIDKFYLRGISFSVGSFENRELLTSSGPSMISILSAILNPFSFLPLFIYFYLGVRKMRLFAICLFLFFASSYEYITLSSRSGLFLIILFLITYLFYFKKIKINLTKIFLSVFFIGAFGVFMTNIFINRTEEVHGSKEIAIKHILTKAGFNYTIEPKKEVITNVIETDNDIYKALQLGYVNFSQYYIHGFFEFGYLYNNYEEEHHYGAYSFHIFAKFFKTIFRTDMNLDKVQKSPPRIGVYTTFFGPIFIDFGWGAVVFMFLLGLFQKLIFNASMKGKFYYLPLVFYASIVTFFMPVVNFITTAQGIYIITAFCIFIFVYSILNKDLIFKKKDGSKLYFRLLK